MYLALLLSLALAQAPQAPAPPPSKPPATTPAQPRAQAPRRAQPAGRSGLAMTVADSTGATIPDVTVDVMGPTSRSGMTDAGGQLSLPGLTAGTYRLRFSGDSVTPFEREVTLRAGQIEKLMITLSRAERVVRETPPPPPPAAPKAGPVGEPQIGSLSKLADRERNTKERREVLLSCSGNARSMLLVLTDEQPQRIYDGAEATYYVLSGQGRAKVGQLESAISEGSFVAVPRGTPFSLARQGNRPLALLWTLSGEPCEAAR